MGQTLVPEFAVSDWRASQHFYCSVLGFTLLYARPEEGFCYLRLGEAELMLDQIGLGRTFAHGDGALVRPLGRGMNLQIRVEAIAPLLASLRRHDIPLFLDAEDRWYRVDDTETGNRQFIVADPDGYLLRFYQDLGTRQARA